MPGTPHIKSLARTMSAKPDLDMRMGQEVRQDSSISSVLTLTCDMTLVELEAFYNTRFVAGEIKEIKKEFDTMFKATVDHIRLTAHEDDIPQVPCVHSTMLEDLLMRSANLTEKVEPVAIDRALTALRESQSTKDYPDMSRCAVHPVPFVTNCEKTPCLTFCVAHTCSQGSFGGKSF